MRNGNFVYERGHRKHEDSSYRTYEEWKPKSAASPETKMFSSYRTYEEWKQNFYNFLNIPIKVLTVPMRNGNIVYGNACPKAALFLPYL